MMLQYRLAVACFVLLLALSVAPGASANDAERVLRVDHYVPVRSTAPAIAAQVTPIYVREVVRVATALGGKTANRVVLFIHGAGTPSAVAFDLQYQDFSWMEYLARAGFDVFAMDMTGYGRSTRPAVMNDPCNLSNTQQLALEPQGESSTCAASYGQPITTLASDWNDIGTVVDYLRALRNTPQLSLIGWSQGGPRSMGYAAQHSDKVNRLVLLAPAYFRGTPARAPANTPAAGAFMNIQSNSDFIALWNSQVGCPDQYAWPVAQAVWQAMLDSDPVGASWGPGVRRAPSVSSADWSSTSVAGLRIPTLMVTGANDKQVLPPRVHELYADLGSKSKVLIDLACSSHNAAWEKNHLLLFQASLDWLTKGSVNGVEQGIVRLGY